MWKGMTLYRLQENLVTNVIRKLKDTAAKTGNDAVKTPSQRIVQKTAEVAWWFNRKQSYFSKQKNPTDEINSQEIYIPPEKRQFTLTYIKIEYPENYTSIR